MVYDSEIILNGHLRAPAPLQLAFQRAFVLMPSYVQSFPCGSVPHVTHALSHSLRSCHRSSTANYKHESAKDVNFLRLMLRLTSVSLYGTNTGTINGALLTGRHDLAHHCHV